MRTKYKILILPLLILTLGLIGCSSDDNDNNDPTPVYVDSPDIVLAQQSVEIKVANESSIDISDGSGEYKAFSLNEAIATTSVSGNKVLIQAIGPGTTTIMVSDKEMKLKPISVSVYEFDKITVDLESIELEAQLGNTEVAYIEILEGNGDYSVKVGDEKIATATMSDLTTVEIVTESKKEGETTITITDDTGREIVIPLKVMLTTKPYSDSALQDIMASSELRYFFVNVTKRNLTNVSSHVYKNEIEDNMQMFGWKYSSWWDDQNLNIYYPAADNSVGVKTGAKVLYHYDTWGGSSDGEMLDLVHFEIVKSDGTLIWAVFSLIQNDRLYPGYFVQEIAPAPAP